MVLVSAVFMASLSIAAAGLFPFQLPCSSFSGTPCICPPGTQYNESTTIAYIGAAASDVESLIGDYFDLDWTGHPLMSVQGPDNFPGLSIRDLNITSAVGYYILSERLVYRFVYPDGSFEYRFEQRDPIPYLQGNGTFAGLWVSLKSDRVFKSVTSVQFSRYFCQTGTPINYAALDQIALSNISSVLAADGKLNGVSSNPVSAQHF